jgi:CIC family chloride channel protein
VGVATWIANLLTHDTIYTLKLRRRGIDLSRAAAANPMQSMTTRDAMEPVPKPLHQDEPLARAVKRLSDEHRDALPVVDDLGRYRGVVTAREVETAMRSNADDISIGGLAKGGPTITISKSLDEALKALVRGDLPALAVLDDQQQSAVGWLTHRGILHAYTARIDRPATGASSSASP